MIIFAKSISRLFIVDKSKAKEFLGMKRNKDVLNKILRKAKMLEVNEIK